MWGSVVLICLTYLMYGDHVLDNVNTMEGRYKRALDAATYGALKYRKYDDARYMENIADGFDQDVEIDKDASLKWFYRLFYRNIGIEGNEYAKAELKKYITLKAIIGYDRMYVANEDDEWIEILYEIVCEGKIYNLTLTNKVLDVDSNKWRVIKDIGIEEREKEGILVNLIKENINNTLNLRNNGSQDKYFVDFGLSDIDLNSRINGISFISFVEGMPLPSHKVGGNEKLHAVSFSGSELIRK